MSQTPVSDLPPIDSEDSFVRTAGRQLLLYTLLIMIGLGALMFLLDGLAGLVGSNSGNTAAVEVESNMITISLADEPPQLDSGQRADSISGMVLGHIMEGLIIRGAHSKLVPGVAESWQINEQDATFWLRKDARWSDGQPVTAHDFVFAWRKAADPAQASEYAFLMYYLKNGEAVSKGEMPLDALGVQAHDRAKRIDQTGLRQAGGAHQQRVAAREKRVHRQVDDPFLPDDALCDFVLRLLQSLADMFNLGKDVLIAHAACSFWVFGDATRLCLW